MSNDGGTLRGRVLQRVANAVIGSADRYASFVNRLMWDAYARSWSPEVAGPTSDQASSTRTVVDPRKLQGLGDEWGKPSDVHQVVDAFIKPFVDSKSIVGEIGVGGGRVGALVAPEVARFYALDVSRGMLKRAQQRLAPYENVEYALIQDFSVPAISKRTFDFLYAFDVFVHLDLQTIWKYFDMFSRAVQPEGHILVHTHDLTASRCWEFFAGEASFTISRHSFFTRDTIDLLAERAGFTKVKASERSSDNVYFERDYIAVYQRIDTAGGDGR
jgi:SAM-dependent methyltransferase